VIFAGTNGYLDKIAVKDVGRFEQGLLAILRGKHQTCSTDITNERPKVKGEPRTSSRPRSTNSPPTSPDPERPEGG
jgi:F-type H+-transporting ATPase subunit alpha